MVRGGEGGRRGPRVDRMGGLVLAMIAGALVPVAIVSALAVRDPLPRDCRSGQATTTTVEGALLYSTGPDLWYSEGYPGKPRKLVDYAPARTRTGPRASPSATAASVSPAPTASPVPTPTASPTPSPTPSPAPAHPTRVVAADISADRKLVAFLVVDPPDHVGSISLLLVSPLDAPGTAPVVPWVASLDRISRRLPTVRVLDNGKVLLSAPVLPASLPAPSPAPMPSPGASAAPASSPSASAAATAATEPSPPPSSPSPPPGVAVVVVAPGPAPTIAAQAPEDYFLAQGHSAWPDTRGYRLPPGLPHFADRVDGVGNRVAGREDRDFGTPLARRHLNEVVLGRAGQATKQELCSASAGVVPTGFSPDEGLLVLSDGQDTLLLDLSATHAATRLLPGRLLAWR